MKTDHESGGESDEGSDNESMPASASLASEKSHGRKDSLVETQVSGENIILHNVLLHKRTDRALLGKSCGLEL